MRGHKEYTPLRRLGDMDGDVVCVCACLRVCDGRVDWYATQCGGHSNRPLESNEANWKSALTRKCPVTLLNNKYGLF